MANDPNTGWVFIDETHYMDTETGEVFEVDRNSLTLSRINDNGTIGEMVDTINQNFMSIAMHGGGPAGKDGINGFDGADGTNVEYIYALSDEMVAGKHYPTDSTTLRAMFETADAYGVYKYKGVSWYDHAQPISKEHKNEYVFSRFRRIELSEPIEEDSDTDAYDNVYLGKWYYAESPTLWAHWGETGKDGDGVEYVFRIYDHELSDDEVRNAFSYLDSMDSEMKAIYNIDDFFPGSTWFTTANKTKAEKALKAAGVYDSSTFENRWTAKFGFCGNGSWTDDPTGTSYAKPYEYVSVRRSNVEEDTDKREWNKYSEPALWSKYSFEGRIFIIYANLPNDQKPTAENGLAPKKGDGWWDVESDKLIFSSTNSSGRIPSIWTDDNMDVPNGYFCWMCSGIFEHSGKNVSWSNPTCISGKDGRPGEDGTNIQFIYALSNTVPVYPTTRSEQESLFDEVENSASKSSTYGGVVWHDRALAISPENHTEYMWCRRREKDSDVWDYDPAPVIWAHWGEDGTDGDGIEYVFKTVDIKITTPQNTWDGYWNLSNDTERAIYSMDDFVPNVDWFDNDHMQAVQNLMTIEGKTFVEADWNTFKNAMDLGWYDNPQDIDATIKYQYVSIRKEIDGVWGPFSYPILWSNYSVTSFKSFVFVATPLDVDLSGVTPTGGTYSNPIPSPSVVNNVTYTWVDSPNASDNQVVWMTSATVSETWNAETNPLVWSTPKKMTDSAGFQVEWSGDDLDGTDLSDAIQALASSTYNFGTYLANNNNDPAAAELAWRQDVLTRVGISFSDSAEDVYLMATCQLTKTGWSNWKLVRVKGEKGVDGTSIKYTGNIKYEEYLDSDPYTEQTASNFLRPDNPNSGELLIVYPFVDGSEEVDIYYGDNTMGGALYMWKYNGTTWVKYEGDPDEPGEAYASPNRHLILWDGDSWQDAGLLVGPEGKPGKNYSVYIEYANDNNQGGKTPVDDPNQIPSAKWIGFLVYAVGEEYKYPFDDLDDPAWKWSLFKGQDGYGYEYIFKTTSSNAQNDIPNVPTTTNEEDNSANVIPTGWEDEPMEPTPTNKYVWMCWRRYDKSLDKWSQFMGKDGKTADQSGKARLWQVYANSITSVTEYFHVDNTPSPANLNNFGQDGKTIDTTFWVDKATALTAWNSTNRYLFNVEVITYADNDVKILNPHLASVYADGIIDIQDYYCLDTDGEIAPAMNGTTPVISGGTEGKTRWTTDVSKTRVDSSYKYLWNINKRIYEDRNEWSTPLVIGVYGEGTNGADSIYIDLDNEMDSVQIDEKKTVLSTRTFKTTLRLYRGAEQMKINSCEIAGEEAIFNNNHGTIRYRLDGSETQYQVVPENGADYVEMTYILTAGTTIPDESIKVVFVVTAEEDNTIIRTTSYNLVGIINSPVYSILPQENAIIEIEGSNSTTLDPVTFAVTVQKHMGAETTTFTSNSLADGFKLYVQKNNDSSTKTWLSTSYAVPASLYSNPQLSTGDKLLFTVNIDNAGPDTSDYETIADKETVYVLRQGKNGADGSNGAGGYGQKYRYARYYTNDSSVYPGVLCETSHTGSTSPTVRFYTVMSGAGKQKQYGPEVSTYPEMSGVNASYTYEYRIERNFVGASASGGWSDPVLVGRYFNTEDISTVISAEVERVADDITTAVTNNLSGTIATVSQFASLIDSSTGQFIGELSSETEAGIIAATMSSVNGIIVSATGVSTFADWVDQANGDIATANAFMSAGGGAALLSQQVAALSASTNEFGIALQSLSTDVNSHFTSLENTVANGRYLTDDSGYLLMTDDSTGEWVRAKTSTGADTSMFSEVSDTYVSKLVSIVNELATVAETVSKGVSCVDILAFVSGSDGEMHSAGAVFQASQDGSSIAFQADNIGIHSSHFNLDKDGITLNTNGGRTSIDSNGVLHANGAIINGNIKADQFEAQKYVDVEPSGYEGTLDKKTIIDANQFLIKATGTLQETGGGSGTREIDNSLFITIIDEVDNTGGDASLGNTLYGVPTLCLIYDNKQYILDPRMWKSLTPSTSSNMRWVSQFSGPTYTWSEPTQTNYFLKTSNLGTSGNSKYGYIFRPEDNKNFLNMGSDETIYRLGVFNWGESSVQSTNKQALYNAGLVPTSSPGSAPYYGAYATRTSILSHAGDGFFENNGSITPIENSTVVANFAASLPSGTIYNSHKLEDYTYTAATNQNTTTYGQSKIVAMINKILRGGTSNTTGIPIWETTLLKNDGSWAHCRIADGNGGANYNSLNDHLLYSSNNDYSHFNITFSYYPLYAISDNGLKINNNFGKVYTILVKCVVRANVSFGSTLSLLAFVPAGDESFVDNPSAQFTSSILRFELSFNLVLTLNNGVSTSATTIKSTVKDLIEAIDFDDLITNKTGWYNNYFKLDGIFYASSGTNYGNVRLRYS